MIYVYPVFDALSLLLLDVLGCSHLSTGQFIHIRVTSPHGVHRGTSLETPSQRRALILGSFSTVNMASKMLFHAQLSVVQEGLFVMCDH
jgi:hypothetical protein